jgi:exosortase
VLLLLMVPPPSALLAWAVFALRQGSASVTYAIFKILNVPVLREGLVFSIPGVNIEVAEECSGIRSSWALLITGLLAGHFFLRSARSKVVLALATVPIAMLKNGMRIATISLLSAYVDRGFLTGALHRNSGIPFSIVGVGILIPVLWALQKSEGGSRKRLEPSTRNNFEGTGEYRWPAEPDVEATAMAGSGADRRENRP